MRRRYLHAAASSRIAAYRPGATGGRLSRVLLCMALGATALPAAGARELPAWERTFAGAIGATPVVVSLTRVDDWLGGTVCNAPCERGSKRVPLQGSIRRDRVQLEETDGRGPERKVLATWALALRDQRLTGTRRSAGSPGSQVVRLRDAMPTPFEIRVVAAGSPGTDDTCDPVPLVTQVRLYRSGRLVQRLTTRSQGTCQIFVPTVIDANFDGAPDLTIALDLPAGSNVPYQTWLYDRVRGRYVAAPKALQDIPSPQFDRKHKTVVTTWRDGCCSHGVTTYRWVRGSLREQASAASYELPVLDGGRRRFCYVTPDYVDGRIEYPDRVERIGGRLQLAIAQRDGCDAPSRIGEARIDIWERDRHGVLRRTGVERARAIAVDAADGTRECVEVPFFADGRIQRIALRDDGQSPCEPHSH